MQRVGWDRYVTFFSLAIAGCAVDLWTKHWIFGRLGRPHESDPIWLVDEVFGLETHLNEGALFGMGQGQTAVFAALSIGAAIGGAPPQAEMDPTRTGRTDRAAEPRNRLSIARPISAIPGICHFFRPERI